MALKKTNKVTFIVIGVIIFLILFAIIGKSKGWIGKKPTLEVYIAKAIKGEIIEKESNLFSFVY